jgi:hypothetical protein
MHQVRHFEEEPGRRSAAKLLTKDEARRIAVNIAKLTAAPQGKLELPPILVGAIRNRRAAFFAATLLALPPLLPVAAIASDTGETYHVTAITTTGSELNQATHSRSYNSLSRYVVIFLAHDKASVIDCRKINVKQNLIRSLCHRSLNSRASLLAQPTDHRGK